MTVRSAIAELAIVGLIASAVACAPAPRLTFPTGVATPGPEALEAWVATTAACRAAATYSAEIVIDGRVGAEKLRGVRLHSAFTRDGRIRLEGVAPIGGPIFLMAGGAERATLTLPRDRRVITAPVADIVNALIGLKFAPADWVDVLTGCVADASRATGGKLGADAVIALGDGSRALLKRDGGGWRVVFGERPESLIEYRAYQGRWPSLARIDSAASAAVALSINLGISQIFVNADLPAKTFTLDVPSGFEPMTLAELRAIGPLGERQ